MSNKRQRNEIPLEKKDEVISYVEELKTQGIKRSQKEIATKFQLKPQTLSDMLKNSDKIKDLYKNSAISGKIKRIKSSKFEKTSQALLQWFTGKLSHIMLFIINLFIKTTGMRNDRADVPINGEILRTKATNLARKLNEIENEDDEIDMNWINRWKVMHSISMKRMAGESVTVSEESVQNWLGIVKNEILIKFTPENIINVDECGLFWKITPDKTLAFKNEQVHGGKKAKDRITVVNMASMTGEKFPLMVIGKSAKPRCFKGVVNLPLQYTSNSKAWMTSEIFVKFVRNLDRKMHSEGRQVALILDRCPAHPANIGGLTNVVLYFLPPNTTSKTQPLDAGIINSMKCHYRKKLVQRMLAAFENEMDFKLDLLEALRMLKRAWESVSVETVVNCFKHVGIRLDTIQHETEETELNGESLQFEHGDSDGADLIVFEEVCIDPDGSEIFDDYEQLRQFIPIPDSFDNFLNFDEHLQTSAALTDDDIISSFVEPAVCVSSEEEDDEDDEVQPPSRKEALEALNVIKKLLQVNAKYSELYYKSIDDLYSNIEQESIKAKKQTLISDFNSNM